MANDTIDTVDQVAKGTPPQLSPKCLRAVEEIGRRTSFSQDAVTSMLVSIVNGRSGMAQFSHSDFGGSGQWMASGAIMSSNMFKKCAQGAGGRVVQRIVRADPERAGRCRGVRSIAKSGRPWGYAAWIIKRSGNREAGPNELVAGGSWRSVEPRNTERSSVRLFSRHPVPRHRLSTGQLRSTTRRTIRLAGFRSNSRDQAPSVSRASSGALMSAGCQSFPRQMERRSRPSQCKRQPSKRPRPEILLGGTKTYCLL